MGPERLQGACVIVIVFLVLHTCSSSFARLIPAAVVDVVVDVVIHSLSSFFLQAHTS